MHRSIHVFVKFIDYGMVTIILIAFKFYHTYIHVHIFCTSTY